jgi:hypothetical protein
MATKRVTARRFISASVVVIPLVKCEACGRMRKATGGVHAVRWDGGILVDCVGAPAVPVSASQHDGAPRRE